MAHGAEIGIKNESIWPMLLGAIEKIDIVHVAESGIKLQ